MTRTATPRRAGRKVAAPRADLPAAVRSSPREAAPPVARGCIFDRSGEQMTPRLDLATIGAGKTIHGPAIIEDAFSTVTIPPGATLTADPRGHLVIAVGAR